MPRAVPAPRRDGRRKRNGVDNNDNNSRPPKRRRNNQSNQRGGTAASLPPAPVSGISAEQKAERDRIVDELAHEINLLRRLPREQTYGKKGKIIKEAKQLYGAWLGENTLKNRANYLCRTAALLSRTRLARPALSRASSGTSALSTSPTPVCA